MSVRPVTGHWLSWRYFWDSREFRPPPKWFWPTWAFGGPWFHQEPPEKPKGEAGAPYTPPGYVSGWRLYWSPLSNWGSGKTSKSYPVGKVNSFLKIQSRPDTPIWLMLTLGRSPPGRRFAGQASVWWDDRSGAPAAEETPRRRRTRAADHSRSVNLTESVPIPCNTPIGVAEHTGYITLKSENPVKISVRILVKTNETHQII